MGVKDEDETGTRAPGRGATDGEASELDTPLWEASASMWDRMVAELDGEVLGEDRDPPAELTASMAELARRRSRPRARSRR
jgi:hypothetical protein